MDGQMDIDITKSAADETGVDLIVCLCVATSPFPLENQNTPALICVQRPGAAFGSVALTTKGTTSRISIY